MENQNASVKDSLNVRGVGGELTLSCEEEKKKRGIGERQRDLI